MRKIITTHLAIEVTQFCNLDCKHCLQGECRNVQITREILERAFDEIKYIEILQLTGGEVFLAYEQVKLVLEIAKEKQVCIEQCSMIINGTVYDERIYDLLEEYFPGRYSISISWDSYHDASIIETFGDTIEIACKNIEKHFLHNLSTTFKRAEGILINTGRAKDLDVFKSEFEAIGYYFDFWKDNGLLVGPYIFLDAEGYITDGNLEIARRKEECLGNILKENIGAMVTRGGIHNQSTSIENFLNDMYHREKDYQHHKGDHWQFENHKLVPFEYRPNTEFMEAVQDSLLLMQLFIEKGFESQEFQEALARSIEKCPHDYSQTIHLKYPS